MNIGSSEVRVLNVSGNLNNPGNSGLSNWNANNDSSNSNWNIVSRAIFCQYIFTILTASLPLGKTHYYLSMQVGSLNANTWGGQKL